MMVHFNLYFFINTLHSLRQEFEGCLHVMQNNDLARVADVDKHRELLERMLEGKAIVPSNHC